MNIEAIVYLVVLFGIPVVVLAASKLGFLPIKGLFKLALLSFVLLYSFIVGSAKISDYQIEKDLYSYDLDGDGSFSADEFTPEAEAAMNRYVQDTGRTFAPLTGFIFSFFYIAIAFGFYNLVARYVLKNT